VVRLFAAQAIRKVCDELQVSVQSMAMEISEKIDRESVGFIVHEKYEEIVRYLQDALQSSLEDENRFKQKADEIQEMVILLTNSKADRTEIQHMQELMVKSEALLKKVGGQMNIKDRLKDFVSRKELDTVLELKVDKLDFEQQLQSVVANTKRNRKLASMAATGPAQVDDALESMKINKRSVVGGGAGNYGMSGSMSAGYLGGSSQRGPGGGGGGGGVGGKLGVNATGGMVDGEALALMMQQAALAAYDEGGAGEGYPSPFMGPDYGPGGGGHSGTGAGGVGFTAEAPRYSQGSGNLSPGTVPVMAIGHTIGQNNNNNGSPGREGGGDGTGTGKGSAFGNFAAKGKGKHPVTSSSLPNTVTPGTFRMATEGGRPGGVGGVGGGHAAAAAAAANRTNGNGGAGGAGSPGEGGDLSIGGGGGGSAADRDPGNPHSGVPDHTSFMAGPVVGGGFNTQSKNLMHKMPGSKPVIDEDVEGKGL
jgi:hypothetical protein